MSLQMTFHQHPPQPTIQLDVVTSCSTPCAGRASSATSCCSHLAALPRGWSGVCRFGHVVPGRYRLVPLRKVAFAGALVFRLLLVTSRAGLGVRLVVRPGVVWRCHWRPLVGEQLVLRRPKGEPVALVLVKARLARPGDTIDVLCKCFHHSCSVPALELPWSLAIFVLVYAHATHELSCLVTCVCSPGHQ